MNFLSVVPPDHPFGPNTHIAFTIGSTEIAWYGITMFLGIFSAVLFICIKMWKWYKIPVDVFYYFAIIAIPTALLGARFWSCVIGDASWGEYWNFRSGGLAIEGGVMAVVLIALIYFPSILNRPKFQIRDNTLDGGGLVRQISIWVYADCIVPAILIGQVIGRWGNYANQELYGPVVTGEGFQHFLAKFLPGMYMQDVDQQYHQPFFLWEGICNLFGFIIIFFLLDLIKNRKIRKCGDLAIIYFLWYGIVRICLQPFRAGDGGHAANMITTELWIAAAVVLLVLNHLVFPRLRKYKMLDWPKVFVNKFFGVKKYKYTEKKGSEIFYYRGL